MSVGLTEQERQAAAALDAHLATAATTVAHIWILRRKDGEVFGFTDHDRDLTFMDVVCRAMSGLNGMAVSHSTGMAVDHSEAIGALTDSVITEADIQAGRYDNAEVELFVVNWADLSAWRQQFRGHIGEISRAGGAFRAELRGLSDQLNQTLGRVYTKTCGAVLGDRQCRFDLTSPGFSVELAAGDHTESRDFEFNDLADFAPGWFARGTMEVLSGAAKGLKQLIKYDRFRDGKRLIGVWAPFDAPIMPNDKVRLIAGCDKRFETCRKKFNNVENFRGFPDLPGEDWGRIVPARAPIRDGSSRR